MSSDIDPADVKEVKKGIFSEIDPVLDKHGFDKSRSGSQTPLRQFDEDAGFWDKGILSKPPRWLIHLVEDDGDWKAQVPTKAGSDRLGYYNLAMRDNVAAISARILPIIEHKDAWKAYEKWEWLVVVFFPEPLPQGSSAEVVSGFDPPNLTLECGKEELTPIAIHVYELCDPDSSCSYESVDLTYDEATNCLKKIFDVSEDSPSAEPAPSITEEI